MASRILKSYYQLRNLERSAHFEFRYQMGVNLVKSIVSRQNVESTLRLGGRSVRGGGKPPYPRLPEHYPPMRTK